MNLFLARKKQFILGAAVFLANVGVDKLGKVLAQQYLRGRGRLSFLGDFLRLEYIENEGAFLGLGAAWPAFLKYLVLLVVPLAICAGALVYILFKEKDPLRIILIACIAGGGVGNLLDRLCNGFQVIDFLNVGIYHFRTGILNIADMSVTFGVIILVIYEMITKRKEKAPPSG
jgi:signal peptidase II